MDENEPRASEPPAPEPPAPPGPPASPGLATGEILPGASAPPARSGRGNQFLIAGVAAVVALGAVGTVVALRSSKAEPALATRVPADAVVFAKISLEPSTDQRQALRRLLDRFPEGDRAKVGPGIERFLGDRFAGTGLSYTREVKPWLGGQIGIAVTAPASAAAGAAPQPTIVALMTAKDEGAARATLTKIAGRGDSAVAVADGVAYIGNSSSELARFRTNAQSAPLSSDPEYVRAHGSVGGDGLAFVWLNGKRLRDFTGSFASGALSQAPFIGAGATGGNGALALRAEDNGFVATEHQTLGAGPPTKTGTPALLESSPATLLGALSVFDLGGGIKGFLSALVGLPGPGAGFDPTEQVRAALREGLGLDVERDIVPWLHGEFSVIVGGITTPPFPDVGILIEPTDQAALTRTMSALRSRLGLFGEDLGFNVTPTADGFIARINPVEIVVRRTKDRLVIASSDRYAGVLLTRSTERLGQDAVYRRSVGPAGKGTVFQLYARIDRIRQLFEAFLPSEGRTTYERDVAPIIRPFETLSMRSTITGRESDFRLAVTVAER